MSVYVWNEIIQNASVCVGMVSTFNPEILTEMYIGHPYLITALFEIRPVAYFGPKQDTFDQQTLLFLLQYVLW